MAHGIAWLGQRAAIQPEGCLGVRKRQKEETGRREGRAHRAPLPAATWGQRRNRCLRRGWYMANLWGVMPRQAEATTFVHFSQMKEASDPLATASWLVSSDLIDPHDLRPLPRMHLDALDQLLQHQPQILVGQVRQGAGSPGSAPQAGPGPGWPVGRTCATSSPPAQPASDPGRPGC